MKKQTASKETVNNFFKAVYPLYTELCISTGSEEEILKDATELILDGAKELAELRNTLERRDGNVKVRDEHIDALKDQLTEMTCNAEQERLKVIDVTKERDEFKKLYGAEYQIVEALYSLLIDNPQTTKIADNIINTLKVVD